MLFRNKNDLKKFGKVVEDEFIIKVYVKKRVAYSQTIKLPINQNKKKVQYIFENIVFCDETSIDGSNCDLLFRNCSFTQSVDIKSDSDILMKHNKYRFYSFADNYVKVKGKKLFIVDNFENTSFAKNLNDSHVEISICGESVIIENSNVCSEYQGNVEINGQKIILNTSTISGQYVSLNGSFISNMHKLSKIKASNRVLINNNDCNFTCDIESPIIIYNGIELDTFNKNSIDINKESFELLKARTELLKQFYIIKTKVTEENNKLLNDFQRKLGNRKLLKVLKK